MKSEKMNEGNEMHAQSGAKPQLTVRANKEYVGSGWTNEGKYGA